MATVRHRTRGPLLVLLLVALPVIAGCSAAAAPTATPGQSAAGGAAGAVAYPLPDLGPSPTPTPRSAAETERLRLEAQDVLWQTVARSWPDAVRPDVAFVGYTTEDTFIDVLGACYTASGLTFGTGTDSEGNLAGISADISTGSDAVAKYTCDAANPATASRPTDAMLGYTYDYLTEFVVPCYAANGSVNAPAPTREDFIATWPNQNWFPAVQGDPPAGVDAVEAACPMLP